MPRDINTNPENFRDLVTLFPELSEKTGLTDEQMQVILENIYYVYNNLGLADIDVGSVKTVYPTPGSFSDVEVEHEDKEIEGKVYDILNFKFNIPTPRIQTEIINNIVESPNDVKMTIANYPIIENINGQDVTTGYKFSFIADLYAGEGIRNNEIVSRETLPTAMESSADFVQPNNDGIYFKDKKDNSYEYKKLSFKSDVDNAVKDKVSSPETTGNKKQIGEIFEENGVFYYQLLDGSKKKIDSKLYYNTGSNTDGAMTQNATTEALNLKLNSSVAESTYATKNALSLTNGNVSQIQEDLQNYYLKTETYSQDEINSKISTIPKFSIEVVTSLPTSNISGTTVYLVKSSEDSSNMYNEYIYVNNAWERLGSQNVDLTGYVQNTRKIAELDLADDITTDELKHNVGIDSILENIWKIKNNSGGFCAGSNSYCNLAGGAIGDNAGTSNGGAVGNQSKARYGGAVGSNSNTNDGGAIGYNSKSDDGGAIGLSAITEYGGAIGRNASTNRGGAIGDNAKALTGGAIGYYSIAGDGFSGGYQAKVREDQGNGSFAYINAIQLGTGTNNTPNSLQVYDDNIYNATTHTLSSQNINLNGDNLQTLLNNISSSIPINNNQLTNGAGYVKNQANQYSYNNLANKPNIPLIYNYVQKRYENTGTGGGGIRVNLNTYVNGFVNGATYMIFGQVHLWKGKEGYGYIHSDISGENSTAVLNVAGDAKSDGTCFTIPAKSWIELRKSTGMDECWFVLYGYWRIA